VCLRVLLSLGRPPHDSLLASLGVRSSAAGFGHGQIHAIGDLRLYDSFHCSRLNTNTGKLTREMFAAVFVKIRAQLDARA
jgi:uracil-DNA glycosylase